MSLGRRRQSAGRDRPSRALRLSRCSEAVHNMSREAARHQERPSGAAVTLGVGLAFDRHLC
jgi:hypothetical protein